MSKTEIYEYYDEYFKETCKSEYTYEDTVKFEYLVSRGEAYDKKVQSELRKKDK